MRQKSVLHIKENNKTAALLLVCAAVLFSEIYQSADAKTL